MSQFLKLIFSNSLWSLAINYVCLYFGWLNVTKENFVVEVIATMIVFVIIDYFFILVPKFWNWWGLRR